MTRWLLLTTELVTGLLLRSSTAPGGNVKWRHLSSVNGDLPVPNSGKEQTASLVCDIDNDGDLDIVFAGDYMSNQVWWWENHESKIADLDGDGNYDILDKIYNCRAPRLDIWLNEGSQ